MKQTLRITLIAVALGLATSHASAQLKATFYGESTFRGFQTYWNGFNAVSVERDNPIQASNSNPEQSSWVSVASDPSTFNVPRAVTEYANGAPYYVPVVRQNKAVSGTGINRIVNGGAGTGGALQLELASDNAGIVVVNTGINDASLGMSADSFSNQMNAIMYFTQRTGKYLIVLKPNVIGEGTNQRETRLATYRNAITNLVNNNPIYASHVTVIENRVTNLDQVADGIHPTAAGYDVQAKALRDEFAASVQRITRERRIASLYVGFLNRVPEAEGGAYWLGRLNNGESETSVAQSFYSATPGFGNVGLTGQELITKYYLNAFGRIPDAAGLNYWEGRRQIVGNGAVLIEILEAAAATNSKDSLILAQKINVGVTYAFILRRSAVNTSALSGIDGNPQKVLDVTTTF